MQREGGEMEGEIRGGGGGGGEREREGGGGEKGGREKVREDNRQKQFISPI